MSPTGGTAGVGRSKKGDAVLSFTEESAFAGARVVFEAKREAGYTVQRALDELDEARKNRGAGAGVFIMARSHTSAVFPRFARHGNNVLVIWHEEDPATDPFLQAAIVLGVSLVSRVRTAGDPGDISALRDVEKRIEDELARLEKMEKHSDAIRRGVDGLSDEIRKAEKALVILLSKAQSTLRALNVEVSEEESERRTPIQLEQRPVAANDAGSNHGAA